MDVDYVINYDCTEADKQHAVDQFEHLIQALAAAGLDTQVRNGGDKHSVLVFVKPTSQEHVYAQVYRSRTKDWLHGVRLSQPDKEVDLLDAKQPLYPAERLRIVHSMITGPSEEGGAGITPKHGQWKNVQAIFALHDHEYNKAWLKKWATQYTLKSEDIDAIRDRFGEKVAFYFAFTQSYFNALVGMAIVGVSSWLLLGQFSPIFAVVNGLLCVTFVEYWRQQEYDLAVRWGVKGVSSIEQRRHDFKEDAKVTDPLTGETLYVFSGLKRLQRQLLIIPFALVAILALGAVIAFAFALEIFMSELYKGPGQGLLVFVPTVIVTTIQPLIIGILTNVAHWMTAYENHATDVAQDTAFTQKVFVLDFITSYLPVLLTAFIYIPFGSYLIPYLDVFNLTVSPLSEDGKAATLPEAGAFRIDPSRLRKQVIYTSVTAQIVNQAMEVVLPYFKRKGLDKYKEMQSKREAKKAAEKGGEPMMEDPPEEASFLKQVRHEAELDVYDVTSDLREMVVQYGHLALFGIIWPPTAASFLANDWLELRTDAVKICIETQRPTPWRSDGIGPWLDSVGFVTWVGSITTAALVHLFNGDDETGPDATPQDLMGVGLLFSILLSEHSYLISRWMVHMALRKMEWPGRRQEQVAKFMVRKRYLEESKGEGMRSKAALVGSQHEEPTRESIEEYARQAGTLSEEQKFWRRQRGPQETIRHGQSLIHQGQKSESKKVQ